MTKPDETQKPTTDSPLLAKAIAHIASGKHLVDHAERDDKGVLQFSKVPHNGKIRIDDFSAINGKNGKSSTRIRTTWETIARAHVIDHREYEHGLSLVTCDGQKFLVEKESLAESVKSGETEAQGKDENLSPMGLLKEHQESILRFFKRRHFPPILLEKLYARHPKRTITLALLGSAIYWFATGGFDIIGGINDTIELCRNIGFCDLPAQNLAANPVQ